MTPGSVLAKSAFFPGLATVVLLGVAADTAIAGPIVPADWNTTTSGTIAGVNFTMNGLSNFPNPISTRDYTGWYFSAAPLSNVACLRRVR